MFRTINMILIVGKDRTAFIVTYTRHVNNYDISRCKSSSSSSVNVMIFVILTDARLSVTSQPVALGTRDFAQATRDRTCCGHKDFATRLAAIAGVLGTGHRSVSALGYKIALQYQLSYD